MQPRRLVLIRHAKAEPYAATDAARPLSERGVADAAALGRWLAANEISPDAALVSTAARTRQTWAAIVDTAGWTIEPRYDDFLYGCEEEGLLELLAVEDDDAATVVVVGHNPTVGSLVHLLDDGEGPDAGAALAGYPTGAAAVLEFSGAWSTLAPGSARLVALHVARA